MIRIDSSAVMAQATFGMPVVSVVNYVVPLVAYTSVPIFRAIRRVLLSGVTPVVITP